MMRYEPGEVESMNMNSLRSDIDRIENKLKVEHRAALAAKDARIAELEELVERCIITLDAYDIEATALDDARLYVTGQQKAEPKPLSQFVAECEARDPQMMSEAREWAKDAVAATHYEGGREVVERYAIGFRRCSGFEHYCDAGMERDDAGEYMTVAQHERIVAEKDAEIARLREQRDRYCELWNRAGNMAAAMPARQQAEPKGCTKPDCFPYCDCGSADDYVPATHSEDGRECQHQRTHYSQRNGGEHVCSNCGESANDAQPARQVGGDEREKFEAWAQQNGIATTRTSQGIAFANGQRRAAGDYILIEALCAYAAWQARAALSPAAVDQWAPSEHEYDRAIHHNPDAKAWADLFVATFPGLIDKHDLMIGWFANAMMAMHDWLKSQEAAQPARQVGGDFKWLLGLIDEECRYWHQRGDEARRSVCANLLAAAKASPEVKAMLAPAAVVMPERKPDLEAMTDHWRENYRAGEADGYNEALDEVARLNRRAIPAGLLERIDEHLQYDALGAPSESTASDLAAELRALLGKEVE